jgi:hypothetical protein
LRGVKPVDFLRFDAKNQPQKINVLKSGAKVGLSAITTKKRRRKNIKQQGFSVFMMISEIILMKIGAFCV